MSSRRRTVVAVIFGGRSVEHDVSIVTGHQVMRAFPSDNYYVVPVYMSRATANGSRASRFWSSNAFADENTITCDGVLPCLLSPDSRHHGLILNPLAGRLQKSLIKRIDVVFPALHGTHGEDGNLQGLVELADIPYVGFATMGSALTNDKIMTKMVLRQAGIPVLEDCSFSRERWLNDPDPCPAGNYQPIQLSPLHQTRDTRFQHRNRAGRFGIIAAFEYQYRRQL